MSLIAVDSSGNGNDGTYEGEHAFAPTLLPSPGDGARDLNPFNRTGIFFNFPTGYVTIPPVAPDWLGPWSLECWARSFEPGFPVFGLIHFTEDNDSVLLGNLDFQLTGESGNDGHLRVDGYAFAGLSSTVTDLIDGDPHHCVATSDGTTMRMYADDVEVYSDVLGPFASDFTATEARIGSRTGQTAGCYGVLDEVAVYDSTLSPTRISDHFSAASSSFEDYTAAVLADAPLSYYHLGDFGAGWSVGAIAMGPS